MSLNEPDISGRKCLLYRKRVRFCCILVPRALNITRVMVSSYIEERKENRCESKSRVKSRWSKDQVYEPNKQAGDKYKPRRVDYVINRLAKTLTKWLAIRHVPSAQERNPTATVQLFDPLYLS